MNLEFIGRCEDLMAHAWMVRTFVKHAPEAESFPELMLLPRAVFDAARALETRADDGPGYARMLRKKLGSLKAAAARFAQDAPLASDHTNFKMAVRSMNACVRALEAALAEAESSAGGPANPTPAAGQAGARPSARPPE